MVCKSKYRKPAGDRIPDLIFDLVGRSRAVEQKATIWLARGEIAVGFADSLVKLDRLLFHPVDGGDRTNAPEHPRTRGLDIDVEDNGQVGTIRTDRKIIQRRDHIWIELARHALI